MVGVGLGVVVEAFVGAETVEVMVEVTVGAVEVVIAGSVVVVVSGASPSMPSPLLGWSALRASPPTKRLAAPVGVGEAVDEACANSMAPRHFCAVFVVVVVMTVKRVWVKTKVEVRVVVTVVGLGVCQLHRTIRWEI